MALAILMQQYGGPEVLAPQAVDVPPPGPGEIRLQQEAIGINFHDIYVRSGLYKTLPVPGIPGIEAVGVIDAVGTGVTGLRAGDRVGYITSGYGAYASQRLLSADLAIRLPQWLDSVTAASVLLKGLTVDMLVRQVRAIKAGDRVLVHAAAGGVGRLLCQWASRLGAQVIGTVGSEDKAVIARTAGCAEVVLYRSENFVERVREITAGRGVDVAYDAVGKDTFQGSLDCLALRGHLVNYGQASGAVPPFEVARLSARSSSVTRPIVFHYADIREARRQMADRLFEALQQGWLTAAKPRLFALQDVAQAHHALETERGSAPLVCTP